MIAAIRSQSDMAGGPSEAFGGKELTACRFRGEAILTLSWAADGQSLAMAGFGGPVRVWAMDSSRPWSLDEGAGAEAGGSRSTRSRLAAYSPDGRALAVGNSEGVVAIWDVASRRKIASMDDGDGPIHSLAWSPDGRILAWSKNRTIRSWEVASGRVETLAVWDCLCVRLAYSPDGRWLAGGGIDGTVRLWDLATGRERPSLRSDLYGVSGLAFTVDSRAVIACSISGPSRIWDAASGEERRLMGDAFKSSAVACSPDGGRLATAARDGTILVRDILTGREVGRLTGHSGMVVALAWSPDGRRLASAGYDGSTRIWDFSGAP